MPWSSAVRIAVMVLGAGALGGCLQPTTTRCADGSTCPEAMVCAPEGGGCVDPGQIAACGGLGEGVSCRATGVDDGVCRARVCTSTTWRAEVVVGGRLGATEVALVQPAAAAFAPDGSLYLAVQNVIQRVDVTGEISIIAGTGDLGDGGDGGRATSAQLRNPRGLAVDGHGQVFVADTGNHRIRRIDADGMITTVAGIGQAGFAGDKGLATTASLSSPSGITVDGLGTLHVADTGNHRVRRVDTAGIIDTVAGTGTGGFGGDGGQAISALLQFPAAVVTDRDDNLYIADSSNHRVRKVTSAGIITTVAGTGSAGFNGDGRPATTAQLSNPIGLALDNAALLIADRDNGRVRRVAGGMITTVAGAGLGSTDGGMAIDTKLSTPVGVVRDVAGRLVVVDAGDMRVRRIGSEGTITTIAGNGTAAANGGGASTNTQLVSVAFLCANPRGGFTLTTVPRFVYAVDGAGSVTALVGGVAGYGGDGGPARAAGFDGPAGLTYDRDGNLYISDLPAHRIRRIDPKGVITTVAGNGTVGVGGDGGPATSAQLGTPYDVAVDRVGNLYIADFETSRIRRVDRAGIITTFAGSTVGFSGDGGDATRAQLSSPTSIAIGGNDELYIADFGNARIRRVAAGKIETIAGGGAGPDGGPATSALVDAPIAVTVASDGTVYLAELMTSRVRRVRDGIISTVAGRGGFGFEGDGGPATNAMFDRPYDVAVDREGRLLISDRGHIRRVDSTGIVTTVVGAIDPGTMGARGAGRLADPRAIALGPEMTLFAGGASGTLQALIGDVVSVVAGRYPHATATGTRARFRDAKFGGVGGVAYDSVTGHIFVTQTTAHRLAVITLVDPNDPTTWTISAFANLAGVAGFTNGGVARARFREPTGLFLDVAARQLYVADTGNHLVRAIDLSKGLTNAAVRTVAGTTKTGGWAGDGGAAAAALLFSPSAVTTCANGDVFIADTGNHRVRRIVGGRISTVLGYGNASSSGEGAPATAFPVAGPRGLGCDSVGNLFVTSTTMVRMLRADATGVVDGTGEVRTIYGLGARDAFPMSATRCLSGLAVTDTGAVRVSDACAGLMLELQRKLWTPG
jgi:sugar lactone lactonase YvrE